MNKVSLGFLICLFTLSYQVCYADWEKALGKGLVRPGQSVGKVALGQTRNEVSKRLGRPSGSTSSRGVTCDTWTDNDSDTAWYDKPFIMVYFSKGKAVQIDAKLNELFLSDYFTLNNTFAQLGKRFKGMKLIKSESIDEGEPPSSFYYDDIKAGIGFFFMTDGSKISPSTAPISISVHTKSRKMITS